MEITDDGTYAVVVSESGEARVFRLGRIDNSRSSNQPGSPWKAEVASGPPDVTSKESDHEAEEPSVKARVKDYGPRAEIESPHGAGGEKKESLARIQSRDKYELGNGRFPNRPKYGDEKMVPEVAGQVAEKEEDRSSSKFFWSRAMTRALVDEYRTLTVEFRNPLKRQRNVWESLANELRRKGYGDVTWDMCDRKWRNLKSTFKTIYYSSRPIYSKRRWEFYDEFKILFAPDVRSTRIERKSRTITPRSSLQGRGNCDSNVKNTADRGDPASTLKQPRWFSEFSDLYGNGYRMKLDLARQRHNRRIEITHRTCELLERLVDSVQY